MFLFLKLADSPPSGPNETIYIFFAFISFFSKPDWPKFLAKLTFGNLLLLNSYALSSIAGFSSSCVQNVSTALVDTFTVKYSGTNLQHTVGYGIY